jgi:16S rRNA (cytosine1402-N4)-methyltransferase
MVEVKLSSVKPGLFLFQSINYTIPSMSSYHTPVMPKETIDFLAIKKNHWYIDCNLGGGGHTELILQSGGKVIGIDMDSDAIQEVAKNHRLTVINRNYHLEAFSENLILYQSNFSKIDDVLTDIKNHLAIEQFNNLAISGILFDLGVSTYQLEEGSRGFSFSNDAPLDMRMDSSFGASAKDLVNGLYEKELTEIFTKYGEENFARPIAKKIVEYRKNKIIETTSELAKIVSSAKRFNPNDKIHPATQVFQALRIVVNDELNSLELALPKAFEILKPSGRLVVISFHSLEDRVVKNIFKEFEQKKLVKALTNKPLQTTEEEISQNPKARSAKLRVIEKL